MDSLDIFTVNLGAANLMYERGEIDELSYVNIVTDILKIYNNKKETK